MLRQQLQQAWADRTEIAPPSAGTFDLDAAYATEAELYQARLAQGRTSVGRKVGFANKAMWRILKLETLVWAHMYDDTVHFADGTHEFSLARCRQPRIEPEIVIKLSQPVLGGLPAEAILAAAEWLALGFEIIDCPYPAWQFQPMDFVACYGLHRALLVGPQTAVDIGRVTDLAAALTQSKIRLSKDGAVVEEGSTKNSLRSPALCISELAGAALTRGEPLEAGEIISTGTLTTAPDIAKGETWHAEAEGLDLAVSARFV